MSPHIAIRADEPQRPPLNLDYRFLALILFCATRADLLRDYLAGKDPSRRNTEWASLRELGLPQDLLEESFYLFDLDETKKSLRQLQLVAQTLIELNDYCPDSCPKNEILAEIAWLNSKQTTPEAPAGTE